VDDSTDLLTSSGEPGPGSLASSLGSALNSLVEVLASAVSSYVGVELTISWHGHPVVLSAVSAPVDDGPDGGRDSCGEALTSLRAPLVLFGAGFEAGGQVLVYAAERGSLIDLAIDLMHVSASGAGSLDAATRWRPADIASSPRLTTVAIALDADLPCSTAGPGLRGLSEVSEIHQAEGVMIQRGHHPDEVSDTLRRQAAAARLSPHAFAAGVLEAASLSRTRSPAEARSH
jgi:hypothetical protein